MSKPATDTPTPKKTKKSRRSAAGRAGSAGKFENYPAAVKWLLEHINIERQRPSRVDPAIFKLDRMRAMLNALGRPEDALLSVHIAGTNGKGSTLAMAETALRSCGYTVGSYTSPHLTDLRERIQVNGQLIPHAQFVQLLGKVAAVASDLPRRLGELTYFELMTAVGILHFADQAVDVALIETGLGGRLDATNVITPAVSAITAIALDHTQFLGNTVAEIAREKAGIFKAGVPALTIKQDEAILAVLRQTADMAGTKLEVIGQDINFSSRFEAAAGRSPHLRIGLTAERLNFEHVAVPLPGEHQALNCGLALAIVDKLAAEGLNLNETTIYEGLGATRLSGRMEAIPGVPRVLIDGAHNPAAVEALIKAIGAHIAYDSMVMIFGCAADKDIEGLLRKLAMGADKVIFTRAKGNPRAAAPEELQARFADISPKMSQTAERLEAAMEIARSAASREDLIVITGSFYLVGEAKKLLPPQAGRSGR